MSETKQQQAERKDVYTRVTERIVELLEQGVRPWHQPWRAEHASGPVNRPLRHNGQRYSGVNVLTLWLSAEAQGFASPFWLTYRQAQELGGHVKKGQHGTPVVYASTFTKKETDDDGEECERDIRFLKEYTAFCADQCEGLPGHFYLRAQPRTEPLTPIERAQRFFAATGAEIRTGGAKAFYSPSGDYIQLPPLETFEDAESYAATVSHELIHWTRHASRLNRDFGQKRFGDLGYAVEELVAELGSAFLAADLELTPEVREDHASYLASWLKVMKQDKRAIFTAASHASRAVEYLQGLQPGAAG